MKPLKIIFCITVLALLTSCNSQDKQLESPNLRESNYPKIIDSLGLQRLYERTKWIMYCYSCDDSLAFINKNGVKDSITFGMLELKYDTLIIRKDARELRFVFYFDGRPCDINLIRNSQITGVVYEPTTDKVLNYSLYADNLSYIKDSCFDASLCKSRFVNPIRPEVIKYIQENRNKLSPWFSTESKRREILEE